NNNRLDIMSEMYECLIDDIFYCLPQGQEAFRKKVLDFIKFELGKTKPHDYSRSRSRSKGKKTKVENVCTNH
ncbi:hypothetical protein AB9G26_09545, partial [Francisella philomiragia]|uniref:hypothetical protein n=1 Tax=Francisella philomiragia TaxID=28110 RepID=UPI0035141217